MNSRSSPSYVRARSAAERPEKSADSKQISLVPSAKVRSSSGMSVFPVGIPIATIDAFEKNSDDNFYNISVTFLNDLKSLNNVLIIENLMQKEQLELEGLESKFVQ